MPDATWSKFILTVLFAMQGHLTFLFAKFVNSILALICRFPFGALVVQSDIFIVAKKSRISTSQVSLEMGFNVPMKMIR